MICVGARFSKCLVVVFFSILAFQALSEIIAEDVVVYRLLIHAGTSETMSARVTVEYADRSHSEETYLGSVFDLPVAVGVSSVDITVRVPGHEEFTRRVYLPNESEAPAPIRIDVSDFFSVNIEDDHFTAQEPFRVAVLAFENTDARAKDRGLGMTVSTMMVSFLKDNSQFSIFERESASNLLEEWRKMQRGVTEEDEVTIERAHRLRQDLTLEGLDGIILGAVSIVGNSSGDGVVEVDARLLRLDGSIQAVAHGSQQERCLRDLVQQVGRSLEQKTLAPHYGELEVHVDHPERVWVHLAPIYLEEEGRSGFEVRAELGFSLVQGELSRGPRQSLWITDPKRYVIRDILGGYYTLRVSRVGYKELTTKNRDWRVRREGDDLVPYFRGKRVDEGTEEGLLLVKVEANERRLVDRGLVLEKSVGTLVPDLKYDFSPVGKISPVVELTPTSLDRDHWPPQPNAGCRGDRTTLGVVEEGPHFEGFATADRGQESAQKYSSRVIYGLSSREFEDLPSGTYSMRVELPGYKEWEGDFLLRGETNVGVQMIRKRGSFALKTTEVLPDNRFYVEGQDTGFQRSESLSSSSEITIEALPLDIYRVRTDVEGFRYWETYFTPEAYPDTSSSSNLSDYQDEAAPPTEQRQQGEKRRCEGPTLKSQMWVAGDDIGAASDLHYDDCFEIILDEILKGPTLTSPQVDIEGDIIGKSVGGRELGGSLGDRTPIQEFVRQIENLDLLVLNSEVLSRIHNIPGVLQALKDFVAHGGVLVSFLGKLGDYQEMMGVPISVIGFLDSKKVVLKTGEVPTFSGNTLRKKAPWRFAKLDFGSSRGEWRSLAVQKKPKFPVILERPVGDGFVIVIGASSKTFYQAVHSLWPKVLRRAVLLAQYSMYRRYDGESGAITRQALERLENTEVRF